MPSQTPVALDPIASARGLPDGAVATIEGVLTTGLGALESGRTGFVQDGTAGIAVYIDPAAVGEPILPAGERIRVAGELDTRYGQRTLRVDVAAILDLGPDTIPAPMPIDASAVGEATEGLRVAVAGEVIETPSTVSDGLSLVIDDGLGEIRVVVGSAALGDATVARGDEIAAIGPLGQRDSSGTGSAGYRVFATLPGELAVLPPAEPAPSPSPTTGPDPSPTVEPSLTAAPSPSPSPTAAGPSVIAIAVARTEPIGSTIAVTGAVTAEAGRIGKPSAIVIDDGTAGIVVQVAATEDLPGRGRQVEVVGTLAGPYGQLEVRPAAGGLHDLGPGTPPAPVAATASQLGEGLEGRLVRIEGREAAAARRASSGDLAIDFVDASGAPFRVAVDASASLDRAAFVAGGRYRLTGVLGQRASRTGALDGYRLWLRDPADLERLDGPGASPAPSGGPSPSPTPSASPTPLTILGAEAAGGATVTIEATVTVDAHLLDGSGRRIVVQDASAAIEVLLPTPRTVRIGDRLRIVGVAGSAYGAPRFRAATVSLVGHGAAPTPVRLGGGPGPSLEWRLVRATGRIADVHRIGDTWRAELEVGGQLVAVSGLAGARIPTSRLVEGATATITGIVRRPYPTATDRRFAIVPRMPADVTVGAAASSGGSATIVGGSGSSGSGGSTSSGGGRSTGTGTGTSGGGPGASTTPAEETVSVDIGALSDYHGQRVRIAGLVAERTADRLRIDDGTGRVWVAVGGPALDVIGDVRVGDALEIVGTVDVDPSGERLRVTDPSDIVLASTLVGSPTADRGDAASPAPEPSPIAGEPSAPDRVAAGPIPAAPVGERDGTAMLVGLVVVLVLCSGAGLVGVRRTVARRRLARRIADRLERFGGPHGGVDGHLDGVAAAPSAVDTLASVPAEASDAG